MFMCIKPYVNVTSLYETILISYYVGVTDVGGVGLGTMFRRQKTFFFAVETRVFQTLINRVIRLPRLSE